MSDYDLYPIRCYTCGSMIEQRRKKYLDSLEEQLDKRRVLEDLVYQRIPTNKIYLELIERDYISEDDLRDIIERYKRPITVDQLFRLLLEESYEMQDIIDLLLDEGAIKEEIPTLLLDRGYITQDRINQITDTYQNQQIIDRLVSLFGAETALNKVGLERYCCRRSMLNPAKLPQGSGIRVGKVIRTREPETTVEPTNSLRAVQQQSTITNQRPIQQLGRIGGSPAVQQRSIVPVTRTISSTPIKPLNQPSNVATGRPGIVGITQKRPLIQPISKLTDRK